LRIHPALSGKCPGGRGGAERSDAMAAPTVASLRLASLRYSHPGLAPIPRSCSRHISQGTVPARGEMPRRTADGALKPVRYQVQYSSNLHRGAAPRPRSGAEPEERRRMPITLQWHDIALRLMLTAFAGTLIGINRGEHGRPAGLRTTLL